ncbi:hypothetical protein AB0I81_27940 [Nonomuraea sp. NPDC050404]|uniref:WXG100 family type VII secretion target n=1 Tax=Nonomuraea sp. NPDC050404 TaxID=3155783 RepID=UPI003405B684
MAKHGHIDIKNGNAPQGTQPSEGIDVIKKWLTSADPLMVDGAGMTFTNAGSKVEQAVSALQTHKAKIVEVWKGPDAELAAGALDQLEKTGNELKKVFQDMGSALQTYAISLTAAQTAVEKIPPDLTNYEHTPYQSTEDTRAQKVLGDLNQKIVAVYASIPTSFSYTLPTVAADGGPPTTRSPNYPTGSETNPAAWYGSGSDGGGSNGNGSGGSGNGSTGNGSSPGNPGGSNPGGSNPGGSDPNNPGGSDPNNPGGSDPNNPGTPDPETPTTPPSTQDPGQPQTPAPGDDDGTVPSVIGDQDRTTTDGTDRTDPNQTDMASYQPPVLTTPTTAVPPTTFTPTPSFSTPTAPVPGSPGIPSVIGSPGVGGPGAQNALAAARAGSGMTPGGMPFMPFMGAGGAGAGEYGDMERNTYMPEDSSSWGCGNETTDPVIG